MKRRPPEMTQIQRAERRREMAAQVSAGRPAAEVAAEHDVSITCVNTACQAHGVRASKAATTARRMAEAVRSGRTPAEVAAEWGVVVESVRGACNRHGVPMPGGGVDRLLVVAGLLRGESVREVAGRLGIHEGTAQRIKGYAMAAGIPGLGMRGQTP